ncbi:MAG: alanine racemase [Actinomyces sp.]|nr:MAG: alanine racemase [Actinomyces sp.]
MAELVAELGEDADTLVGRVRPTVTSPEAVAVLAATGRPWRVHVKVDTGMHRVGVAPGAAAGLVELIDAATPLEAEGVWTHFAVADEPDDAFTDEQLRRFRHVLEVLTPRPRPLLVHLANSAATLTRPDTHADLVRCGIALYGVPPAPALTGAAPLRPALRLVARVREVRTVEAGETVSYGRRWRAHTGARVATIPVGYADGLRRSSSLHGVEVLVRGRRRPLVGAVTMDQAMVAVDDEVAVGDEVVLIGRQGDETITATEVATRLGTIAYEVLTDLGPRLPRVVTSGGRP